MDLAIDGRYLVGQRRGMGKYALSLVEPVKTKIKALLPAGYPDTKLQSIHYGSGFYPYWEQIALKNMCKKWKINYLICPYNTAPIHLPQNTKLILVVHDLIYLESLHRLPLSVSVYQNLGRLYRRIVVPKVIKQAHRLITVSNFTREQIQQQFEIPKQKIIVIPNSIDDEWLVDSPLQDDKRDSYILCVSGESPNKNLPRLLRAFAKLKELIPKDATHPKLRIVGIKPNHHQYFVDIANSLMINKWIQFESYLCGTELKQLYRRARLFVLPSLFEGFGIPLLEAMASGTPIVCSNTTSLPEVIGNSGWTFNPEDESDMALVLCSAWQNTEQRREYALEGLKRVQSYRYSSLHSLIRNFWKTL
ncbi:TPA: glycosyltransferase family 4 protein [Legionella pneumophila]